MTPEVLRAIQQGAAYGYQIHRVLQDTGFAVRLNHLYPILRRMENDGLLTSSQVPGDRGPMRRQYAITAAGRRHLDGGLADAIAIVRLSYLEHLSSDETTMRRALDLLAKYLEHTKPNGRTALVVPPGYLSEFNFRWFLTQLFDIAQGDVYLVRPAGTFEIDEPRITLLDGSETYIPLSDRHVDNLLLIWVPQPRRWHRPRYLPRPSLLPPTLRFPVPRPTGRGPTGPGSRTPSQADRVWWSNDPAGSSRGDGGCRCESGDAGAGRSPRSLGLTAGRRTCSAGCSRARSR